MSHADPAVPSRSSPAPRRSRIPRWFGYVAALLLGLCVVGGGLAVWRGPSWVAESAVRVLEDRTGHEAAVGRVAWRDGRVVFEDVRIEGLARLDEIAARIEMAAWLPPRPKVASVHVVGGRVEGDLDDLSEAIRRATRAEEGRRRRGESAGGIGRVVVEGIELRIGHAVGGRPVVLTGRLGRAERIPGRPVGVDFEHGRIALGDGGPQIHVGRAHADVRPRDPFPLRVSVEGGGVALREGFAVAGAHGQVEIADAATGRIAVVLDGGLATRPDDGATTDLWHLEGEVDPPERTGTVTVTVDDVALGPVAEAFTAFPWLDVSRARFDGKWTVTRRPGVWDVAARGDVEGVTVHHPLLASTPIDGLDGTVDVAARWNERDRALHVEHLEVSRHGARFVVSGLISRPFDGAHRRLAMTARVPEVDCAAVLDALGPDLLPALSGFRLGGRFAAEVTLEADFADLESLRLGGRVGIDGCRVLSTPARAHPSRLRSPFTHRVQLRDGSVRLIRLFPGSGSFTSLDGISPYMVAAVLTTEDGGFFRHRGFLPSQFEQALRRNLEAGRVRLGASTITMQLAKNLFLSHERTISRKLQELFLTWHLERVLDKRRILELYLNIVEFGPGVYGVTEAARHYFGKHPRELTPLEAFYLAAMLPSPVRRHVHHCRGHLSKRFAAKLRRLLAIAADRGRIDAATYETWKDAELVFVPAPEDGDEATCLARIERLVGASRQQAALSGLVAAGPAGPVLPPPPVAVERPATGFGASGDGVADAEPAEDVPAMDAPDPAQGN